MDSVAISSSQVDGGFVDLNGERYYAIYNVDKMAPFFISVVSDSDHWLFISSYGGLTAGRESPETALFPYLSVDKIHESTAHTGSKTILRVRKDDSCRNWEPFNKEHDGLYSINRHLYKNAIGNKICFEETNHDLQLMFRYWWMNSDEYGFVRQCELQNSGAQTVSVEMIDGLQNILPAGTPRVLQSGSSNLIDAYKWTELDESSGLAFFTLNSGITDRPEPCESLKANTIFSLGLENPKVLISALQLERFKAGEAVKQELHKRGIRGAYLVNQAFELEAQTSKKWQLVANVEQSQRRVAALRQRLKDPATVKKEIDQSIENGSDQLARIMACADSRQLIREEAVAVHHYANVLFNVQRGGGFVDQYRVTSRDFVATVKHFNKPVFTRNKAFLKGLPATLDFAQLLHQIEAQNDDNLERLCYEYLPLSFGRRHGDPSRPWNQFAIKLKDETGNRLLSYQGNWRDIFQNWEALALSYPEFIENMIAKFVNASTIDGYNPYRITKEGIDWEVEDESDPWSFIGYWGDHQIIYLLKLLEQSNNFHPARLGKLLHKPIFSYANVPYRLKAFEDIAKDPKDTVVFDHAVANEIEHRVAEMGADAKLVLDSNSNVYHVNLLEKMLVTLLAKLSNLVVEGGIWLNTQRPEWNDANNALVGQGLSMVTLYYLRRYLRFMQGLLADLSDSVLLSTEVSSWLDQTAESLAKLRPLLGGESISADQRYQTLVELGESASRYRQTVYQSAGFSGQVEQSADSIHGLLADSLVAVDHSIRFNLRDDGLYHAYNLMKLQSNKLAVDHLYIMLEGQVAALSSGAVAPEQAVTILEELFASDLYRDDQQSFILYPDRKLPGFLQKNRIDEAELVKIPLAVHMLEVKDSTVLARDVDGYFRFNAEMSSSAVLDQRLDSLIESYGIDEVENSRDPLRKLYETVFNHQAFTGRSGGMFGFEGLGSIYWHMVSKLLLVAQENYFAALDSQADKSVIQSLGTLYYRVRHGIGFNKTPSEYGAFPTDPYSHTPAHAGARQPGMTGQVKEEVISRFGELGIRINNGVVSFQPRLLRKREFLDEPLPFRYLDLAGIWREIEVPSGALAFTWCQVPIIYQIGKGEQTGLSIGRDGGDEMCAADLSLSYEDSQHIFSRDGHIQKIMVTLDEAELFHE